MGVVESYGDGWFKVSRRLFDSSRWHREDPATLKLLLFLVGQAQDPLNPEPGTVLIGDTGLASRLSLPVETVRRAIERLCLPDPESRSQPSETLERVPGGVRLVNHDLYHPGMAESMVVKRAARVERARKAAAARWGRRVNPDCDHMAEQERFDGLRERLKGKSDGRH